LIATGKYRLKSTDLTPQQISAGLTGIIFEEAGENGPESLFEIQYTDVQGAVIMVYKLVRNVAAGFAGPLDILDLFCRW
jgi:hypothetical protein